MSRGATQPPIEYEQWTPIVFRETFAMAAGNNVVFLPGWRRGADLNPASFPQPSTRGGVRWLSLNLQTDTALAAGDDVELSTSFGTFKTELFYFSGSVTWLAGAPMGLIRAQNPSLSSSTYPASVWVPDPMLLFVRLLSQLGTENLTISGVYLITQDREKPPPDLYA